MVISCLITGAVLSAGVLVNIAGCIYSSIANCF